MSIEITKENIDELTDGNYFSEDVAVKYDLQNGKINTVSFCICKGTARDTAKGLNLYDNIMEELG
jgi:hypothetical protein|tara:strand:+ start:95 stop:289 length:195 start_codon:yes stop_codon:yes gene_type:complete